MPTLKRKGLAKKAVENTTIVKKVANEKPETIKLGNPLDHVVKHDPKTCGATIGMSKGITKNMENFESLRVDVWLSDTIKPDETQEQALTRIEAFIDEALETAVTNTVGD